VKPGETTVDEVLRLCGQPDEEQEQLGAPGQRPLVYHGKRLAPQRKRSWGWIGTVDHWEMEQQNVEITVDRDVQAGMRRARFSQPPGPDDFAA
jgi:hypothetical protein